MRRPEADRMEIGRRARQREPDGLGLTSIPALRLRHLRRLSAAVACALLSSCQGIQSTFSAFGAEAESTRALTVTMVAAAAVITIAVLALAFHAVRAPEGSLDHRRGMRVILWLGAIGPTLILAVLLASTLPTLRTLAAKPGDLEIHVEGEQFWWRVRYRPAQGEPVEAANEIRLPVGRTVAFSLASPDVIHSFWIPGLAGKMDMIPGRTNRLVVQATSAGAVSRSVRGVLRPEPCQHGVRRHRRWRRRISTGGSSNRRARRRRRKHRDGNCSTSTAAWAATGSVVICDGSPIGPDLTHFGSRPTSGRRNPACECPGRGELHPRPVAEQTGSTHAELSRHGG